MRTIVTTDVTLTKCLSAFTKASTRLYGILPTIVWFNADLNDQVISCPRENDPIAQLSDFPRNDDSQGRFCLNSKEKFHENVFIAKRIAWKEVTCSLCLGTNLYSHQHENHEFHKAHSLQFHVWIDGKTTIKTRNYEVKIKKKETTNFIWEPLAYLIG